MNNDKNLDMNSTPNLLEKEINETGVKKLNKGPIILISIALMFVLIGLFYAAMQRGAKNNSEDEIKKTKNVQNDSVSKMISEMDTRIQSDPTPEKVEEPIVVINENLQNNTVQKTTMQQQKPKLSQDQLELIRLKRQLALKALTGPTQLNIKTEEKKQSTQTGFMPNLTNRDNTNSVPGNSNNALLQNYIKNMSGDKTNNDKRNQDFLNQETSYDYLAAKKTPLLSPYELKTGTLIPSVLITGANSDLPGRITGQVRENVYDSATGQYLLIPQGTRLIGEYSANVVYGQSRLLVAWNRLIFPDGQTLNLGKMLGADQGGYTGLTDEVDNHYVRIFGSAFMMSAISAGVQMSSGDSGTNQVETNTDKAIGGAIQQLGQVGTEMIRKNMDISPTLSIRPGYRFNIFITKDIILEPLGY